jgi:hypothetical protein
MINSSSLNIDLCGVNLENFKQSSFISQIFMSSIFYWALYFLKWGDFK